MPDNEFPYLFIREKELVAVSTNFNCDEAIMAAEPVIITNLCDWLLSQAAGGQISISHVLQVREDALAYSKQRRSTAGMADRSGIVSRPSRYLRDSIWDRPSHGEHQGVWPT